MEEEEEEDEDEEEEVVRVHGCAVSKQSCSRTRGGMVRM
jgi:hypothetical protein